MNKPKGLCGDCGWHKQHYNMCGCPCFAQACSTIIDLDSYKPTAPCNCSCFIDKLLLLANPPKPTPDTICGNCQHWSVVIYNGTTFEFTCHHPDAQPVELALDDDDSPDTSWYYDMPCNCRGFELRRGYIDVTDHEGDAE